MDICRTPVRLGAACLALVTVTAGCAAGSAPAPRKIVSLSLTAPINGATLGVRRIEIAGTVSPADAQVMIGGRAVQVVRGAFTQSTWLASSSETITIAARAHGFVPAVSRTTVSYSSQTAAQILSARMTAVQPLVFALRASTGTLTSTPVALRAPPSPAAATVNSAFSISGPGTGAPAPSPGPGATPRGPGTTPPPSGAPSPGPGATPPPSGAPSPGPGATPPPSGAPSPGPGASQPQPQPQPQPLTAAQIQQLYVQSCVKHSGGPAGTSYCQCTYRHIAATGALRSTQSLTALRRSLLPYERTHNVRRLPAYVHQAILACLQDLPDNNVAAAPVVNRLPSLNYPGIPGR